MHWPSFHKHKKHKQVHRRITGYISKTDGRTPFERSFDQLVAAAKTRDASYVRYKNTADHFANRRRRIITRLADTLDYTLMYRGVSPSSEAGDVILSEKNKVKGFASARYMQQKVGDDLSLKLSALTLQMATDSGNRSGTTSAAGGGTAYAQVVKLAGASAASKMQQAIAELPPCTPPAGASTVWSVTQLQTLVDRATAAAARRDHISEEIRSDVGHFAYHKKGTEKTHKTVRVALSAASLSPTIVGPACQATLFGYLACTGGPEQSKLLKELYLNKRLTGRAQLLSEQSRLALETYEQGLMTGNGVMIAAAKQMIIHLTGENTAQTLLSARQGTL
ncbi:MAG TPA: hypothetical protein V6D22_19635 [Candidatus Obscuribacterales bacterium]